jgi:hypothetical protein
LALSADLFLQGILNEPDFAGWFGALTQLQESHLVTLSALELMPQRFEGWHKRMLPQLEFTVIATVRSS